MIKIRIRQRVKYMKTLLKNEQIFNGKRKIKYLFIPSKKKTEHLVVMFSGFNPIGTPPAYNYIRTLQHADVNKLYILDDYGSRGCYYLGENRVFDVEASVYALIRHIASANKIKDENIICCGSSKGGYAALYYSIKYGFGHAIVAAPQTYLGRYLYNVGENPTLAYIAGGTSQEDVAFCNDLLFELVRKVKKVPKMLIHVGRGDHHYKGHVLPFIDHLQQYGFSCGLDVGEFANHGEVSFYQKLLVSKLKEIVPLLEDPLEIKSFAVEQNQHEFLLSTQSNQEVKYAWYIFKDKERVKTFPYTDSHTLHFIAVESGCYHFVSFVKDADSRIVYQKSSEYKVEIISGKFQGIDG
jgi:hypothetical protein